MGQNIFLILVVIGVIIGAVIGLILSYWFSIWYVAFCIFGGGFVFPGLIYFWYYIEIKLTK